jgi:hypothetical protein
MGRIEANTITLLLDMDIIIIIVVVVVVVVVVDVVVRLGLVAIDMVVVRVPIHNIIRIKRHGPMHHCWVKREWRHCLNGVVNVN